MSTYHTNLELLAAALPKNASFTSTLYAKSSVGAAPDTVYGLTHCRGDTTNTSTCSECATAAFWNAQELCTFNKDTTIFYDICIVRFADWDFSGAANHAVLWRNPRDIEEPMLPGWDPDNSESVSIIINMIKVLLQGTAKQAAYNSPMRYATGHMDASSTFPPLYSLAQCTPDLPPSECWACFQEINNQATEFFNGIRGGRVLAVPCNLRYETSKFYQGNPIEVIPSISVAFLRMAYIKGVLIIATVVPLLASTICFIFCFGLIRRKMKGKVSLHDKPNINLHEEELVWGLEGANSEFTFFDFSQVSDATSAFSDENKLGQGGFGPVYKGQFPDGREVAIKRLASHSGQGFMEFKNEVQLIAKLQHTNLVRLLGCCSQADEKILIYEYLPNKSLDFFIFDETRGALLNWNKRIVIIEGIAQGLLYLHRHSRLRVIHRDLKASNILLDNEMNPKISDFGLAKIFSSNDTGGNTKKIAGTYGYMAPEYASEGIFSVKSDVFSYGVLMLEIINGKRNSCFHQFGDFFNLLGYAWKLWKEERWLEFVDAAIVPELHASEAMRCINIALLCVQENAADRPTTSSVVAMLSSESVTLPEPNHPAYFHVRVTNEEPSSGNDVTVSVLDGR
ncbi:hypothetical protein BRADI_4g14220v3 [Brachypodium distachyon]|uniref:Protein kinase domain-containing protein n=1 Tax=Brachypodium distachyon TaxID=15368 RepID=A0A0Q3EJQ3_BRADI|nr:hypothetical protein BRADI_4g14220v3 [Brachypodium distachyon]